MTREDNQLLLKDLCVRLPYGVKIATRQYNYHNILTPKGVVGYRCYINDNPRYDGDYPIDEIKPYLRPMSSMTEEEKEEYEMLQTYPGFKTNHTDLTDMYDWLNARHFDYRGLIEKGLALEAPEGMYKTE